jgi:hypothetical protein
MDDKDRTGYLKDEYLFCMTQYEDFDRRSLTIKGWLATGAIAAFGLAANAQPKVAPLVLFSVAIVSLTFWVLETYWKMFQYGYQNRIRTLEAYFRNDPDILVKDPPPFQAFNAWFMTYVRDERLYQSENRPRPFWSRFFKLAIQPFICLPYAVLIILSAGGYFAMSGR